MFWRSFIAKSLLAGIVLAGLSFMPLTGRAESTHIFSAQFLSGLATRYGKGAKERLLALRELVLENEGLSDREKLEAVNSFWNRTPARRGRVRKSLATPVETLAANLADCKDYSTGKYLTLVAMGVDAKKLRLAYVIGRHGPHMVLKYHESPELVPLVLDNVALAILPEDMRPDLRMVLAFNDHGMWVFNMSGQMVRQISTSPGFWRKMRARIGREPG